MKNSQISPPAQDELEVSVFGPGYGEAILLHIGAGKWFLVDSCLDPISGQPASLQYLFDLNVNVGQAVKLVVATHWHDDHVRGISNIFKQCQSAEFVISNALRVEEFLTLTYLSREPSPIKSSGLDEFSEIFQLLEARKQPGVRFNPPKFATADKLIYRDQIEVTPKPVEVKISALSPSDASILQAGLAFAELLAAEEQSRKRLPSLTPNHTSVVLWVEVGHHKILLGADLEKTSDPRTGWSVILNNSTVVSGKAGVFKVPHHGSETAHHAEVWSELLLKEPFAVVTPFSRGKKLLPSSTDVERLTRLTLYAYATSPTRLQKLRWRDRIVRDYVDQVTQRIYSVHQGWGHVRLRQKIEAMNDSWQVELFGDAYALNR